MSDNNTTPPRYKGKRTKKQLPVVWVEFLDHAHQTGSLLEFSPCKCEVFGVLYKEDKTAYYVASWVTGSDITDDNNEAFCILKSAVTAFEILA